MLQQIYIFNFEGIFKKGETTIFIYEPPSHFPMYNTALDVGVIYFKIKNQPLDKFFSSCRAFLFLKWVIIWREFKRSKNKLHLKHA